MTPDIPVTPVSLTPPEQPPKKPLPDTLDPSQYMHARVAAITLGGKLFRGADSRSMLGTGYNKGYLVVKPEAEYQPGQDVTYIDNGGAHTTHRITHVKPGFVYTKGINNRAGDGWIPVEKVVGRVVWPPPKM